MKAAVWLVASIVALNVLLVATLAMLQIMRRYRAERTRRRLERIGHVSRLPSATSIRRDRVQKLAGLALAATFAWVLFGVGGVRAARVTTSALGTGATGIQTSTGSLDRPTHDHDRSPGGTRSAPGTQEDAASAVPTGVVPNGVTNADGGAPAAVAAVLTAPSAIRLAWTRVPGTNRYDVQRSFDAVNWVPLASTQPNETSYTDVGLSSGTTYYYRVVAVTDTRAVASDAVSATTAPEPLDPPTMTAVSSSSTTIDLAWGGVADGTGYRIERSANGTDGWATIATTGQDVTSYTDAGLSPGTTYFYRIFTEGAGGESAPSDVSSATTAAEQGSIPGGNEPVAEDPTAGSVQSP
jgi:large repetitive protein